MQINFTPKMNSGDIEETWMLHPQSPGNCYYPFQSMLDGFFSEIPLVESDTEDGTKIEKKLSKLSISVPIIDSQTSQAGSFSPSPI
jgi:hypothetical protein